MTILKSISTRLSASTKLRADKIGGRWDYDTPRDLGLDSIRAMSIHGDPNESRLAYAAFDGETLEVAVVSEGGDIDNIQFDIRRGNTVSLVRINDFLRNHTDAKLTPFHVLYLLSGIKVK